MTTAQNTIVIITLLLVAAILFTLFCNVSIGHDYYGVGDFRGNRHLAIVPMGNSCGIVARSRESFIIDGVFGIAVPIALIGAAAFVSVSPRRPRTA